MAVENKKQRELQYRSFLRIVQEESQRESTTVNSRVLWLLFWCVVAPAFSGVALLVLIRFGLLPTEVSGSLNFLILAAPLGYFTFIFGRQVVGDVRLLFKKGGMALAIEENLKEANWRRRVCDSFSTGISLHIEDWTWIHQSFATDLGRLKQRGKTITILAGAILLFIWKGLDWASREDVIQIPNNIGELLALVLAFSNEVTEWIAFFLVLLLLYTSGNQSYENLKRYLQCIEQLILELREKYRSKN